MKCNRCDINPTTVGAVRACVLCTSPNDGTANEIPKHLTDADALATAVGLKPGLANRFTPERPSVTEGVDPKVAKKRRRPNPAARAKPAAKPRRTKGARRKKK